MEGLNVLGNIPWKINHLVLDTAWKCWENGVVLGDIPSKVDYEIPPLPMSNDYIDYKTLGEFSWNHIANIEKRSQNTTDSSKRIWIYTRCDALQCSNSTRRTSIRTSTRYFSPTMLTFVVGRILCLHIFPLLDRIYAGHF